MKRSTSPKHFSEAIALVTIVSCLLGLRVFEYPRGHPRPILSLIYLLFLYIIYFNGSLRVHEIYYANIRLMKLEYILYQLLTYVIIASVIMKMLLGWWHTKKFKICHKKIFEIDETLRQLGLTVNYDRIYYATIGTITVWISVAFIVCTVIFFHLKIRTDVFTTIYLIFVLTYSFSVNSINVFEFYMFARCLEIKFGLVNQLLRGSLTDSSMKETKLGIFEIEDLCKSMGTDRRKQVLSTETVFQRRPRMQSRINVSTLEKQDPIVYQIESHTKKQFPNNFHTSIFQNQSRRHTSTMTKCHKHMLQVIKQVHLELCKVSKLVCTILGVQIAWEMGVIIMFITGGLYNLYIRFIMNQHKVKGLVGDTFVTLTLCSLQIIKAISLNRVCKNAANEGNKTIEIIHTIYGCNADIDMREEIQQFGIQILQSPVTFSAFGLTLNYRVLSMILKTVTTYMVIMVQVSNILESNNAIEYSYY